MGKLTKNQKLAAQKIEAGKAYSLKEAAQLVKEITFTKFDASLDIDVRLGVDPRKANQMVRGVVSLPHGTGKQVRVLVLCTPDAETAAKEAGADYVGLDEYIEKIKGGWTQTKGTVKEQWGKLTDDDLLEIQGRREQLVGKIQTRYGISLEEAEAQVSGWEHKQQSM
jgi:ribosomal protein L1